jgi:hypothetical protein
MKTQNKTSEPISDDLKSDQVIYDEHRAVEYLIHEIKALKRKLEQQSETIAINRERIIRLEAKLKLK